MPFFEKAHIAYTPNGQIVGLSKSTRVVNVFALLIKGQEHLTEQILICMNDTLKPKGVAIIIEVANMCMNMRCVQKQNYTTTTLGFFGDFEAMETRNEFLKLTHSSK